jgi:hypothetical protein
VDGVSFSAWQGDEYRRLVAVLAAIGPPAVTARWRLRMHEVFGESAETMYELAQQGTEVSGERLAELDHGYLQIVDGELTTILGSSPAIVVRAVDSSWWDVESDTSEIIDSVRRAFPDATELPSP